MLNRTMAVLLSVAIGILVTGCASSTPTSARSCSLPMLIAARSRAYPVSQQQISRRHRRRRRLRLHWGDRRDSFALAANLIIV